MTNGKHLHLLAGTTPHEYREAIGSVEIKVWILTDIYFLLLRVIYHFEQPDKVWMVASLHYGNFPLNPMFGGAHGWRFLTMANMLLV